MSKEELRKKYIAIRKGIIDKDIRSIEICKEIINLKEYKLARVVALYKSLKNEVNTDFLIEHSLNEGKTVLLPKVIGDNIVFYKYQNGDRLVKSSFGVNEPLEGKHVNKDLIDLIIVPGICFDKEGNRLGYGKGYYDRYLKEVNDLSVGICFKEQFIERVETDENDVKVKKLIYK